MGNDKIISLRYLAISIFFALFIAITAAVGQSRAKVVFCDVGQGDAAYIRSSAGIDILVDAGPGRPILRCLSKYMPFYDREIELFFISHPQKDHYGGLEHILNRYKIKYLILSSRTSMVKFHRLIEVSKIKGTKPIYLFSGDSIGFGEGKIEFFWPQQQYQDDDPNVLSQILVYKERDVSILFTGDIVPKVQKALIKTDVLRTKLYARKISILKVPHHGSKNGLTKEFLKLADPYISVISVGSKNSYGHPSKEVLDMLKAAKIQIKRTDKEGDIVFEFSRFGK